VDETPDLLPGDQRTCSSERSTGALKCGRSEAGRAAQSKMAAIVTTLSHQLGANQGSRPGDAEIRFLLVRLHRELLRDKQIRPMSDWGSSGRRFESCRPDQCQPDQSHRSSER
jgi:hypothetical protein